jgi:glycosyltransferase involved in cell wall biosynthesis
VTYYPGGPLAAPLHRAPGVRHVCLGKRGRWDTVPFLARLLRTLRRLRPQVLHSYLDSANILAALAKPLLPGTRIVWGVRASNMDWRRYDWLQRCLAQLERRLAPQADLIIANSQAGKAHYLARGYPADRLIVIPNGIDTDRFRPDPAGRARLRAAWRVGAEERLIGLVARLDPMKDHPTFLRAAAQLACERLDVRFVCVGGGPASYRAQLQTLATALGLGARLVWAGEQAEMAAVYSALDVACLSSAFGEGFPNVVGEAMACEVPCVVTDVGDAALIVGDTGAVVPPGDPAALAAGLRDMLRRIDAAGAALGARARARVAQEYSTTRLVAATAQALAELLVR